MYRIKNDQLWKQTRYLFLASAVLFLANIIFGFDNALSVGTIPRWQELVHVHAGTLGWVTLSILGLAIWAFTGQREVSRAYVRRVTALIWVGILGFGGYIATFGLAFALGRPWFYLMPVFGITSSLVIWAGAIYSLVQLRRQPVVTSLHLLLTTGLLVAALGSTMGVLLGLEYVVGFFIPGQDRIGVHAGVMDGYLLLAAASVIEIFVRKSPQARWNLSGLLLCLAWGISTIFAIIALLFNIMPLIMMAVPLLLLGLLILVVRGGWRAIATNPFGRMPRPWAFFGTLWTVFWGAFFAWLIVSFADNFAAIPSWVGVVFAHAAFVGMMTNLLLGAYSLRTQAVAGLLARAEPAAMWLINLGLLAFFALKLAADIRLGAIVMGVGVLLGLGVMVLRLLSKEADQQAWQQEPATMGVD